jgi:hypothetical protein
MKMVLLRLLLLGDAAVLLLLGVMMVVDPVKSAALFGFGSLPATTGYLIAMWGCAMVSMGYGCGLAAARPLRHLGWIQAGIVRGAAETLVGCVCVARGSVSVRQAALGTALAAFMAVAYLLLYPRGPRAVRTPQTPAKA